MVIQLLIATALLCLLLSFLDKKKNGRNFKLKVLNLFEMEISSISERLIVLILIFVIVMLGIVYWLPMI
ncbi:MAG: hypothetical protein AB8H03_14755 [Saprospiraceae bacterium]